MSTAWAAWGRWSSMAPAPTLWSSGTGAASISPIPRACRCGVGPGFCWIERIPGGGSRVVALRSTNIGGSVPNPRMETGLTVVPNPVRGGSTIAWSLPQPGPARVEIFDAAGRTARTFAETAEDALQVAWDGRMGNNVPGPSGSYLVRLVTPQGSAGRTVVRIRCAGPLFRSRARRSTAGYRLRYVLPNALAKVLATC